MRGEGWKEEILTKRWKLSLYALRTITLTSEEKLCAEHGWNEGWKLWRQVLAPNNIIPWNNALLIWSRHRMNKIALLIMSKMSRIKEWKRSLQKWGTRPSIILDYNHNWLSPIEWNNKRNKKYRRLNYLILSDNLTNCCSVILGNYFTAQTWIRNRVHGGFQVEFFYRKTMF